MAEVITDELKLAAINLQKIAGKTTKKRRKSADLIEKRQPKDDKNSEMKGMAD